MLDQLPTDALTLYRQHLPTLLSKLGTGVPVQLIRFASVLTNCANPAKTGLADWLCPVEKPGLDNGDIFRAVKSEYRQEANRLGAQGDPAIVWG